MTTLSERVAALEARLAEPTNGEAPAPGAEFLIRTKPEVVVQREVRGRRGKLITPHSESVIFVTTIIDRVNTVTRMGVKSSRPGIVARFSGESSRETEHEAAEWLADYVANRDRRQRTARIYQTLRANECIGVTLTEGDLR